MGNNFMNAERYFPQDKKFEEERVSILEKGLTFYQNKETKEGIARVEQSNQPRKVNEILYEAGDIKIRIDEKGIDVNGRKFSYDTLAHFARFLGREGEFAWKKEGIRNEQCAWCGKPYERSYAEVYRGSVNGLRYCSDKCRNRVTNLMSSVRRTFEARGARELSIVEIAEGMRERGFSHLSLTKLESYLGRIETIERDSRGKYRLKTR